MKKLFVLLLTLSLMIGAFCITAVTSSADDSNGIVMTVSGMTENGSKILTEHYYNFEAAWDDAARYAKDHEWMAENGVICIVVDLQADWVAEKGKFGEDNVGFKESTIYIPENTKMMINMQGHTIDRGLTKAEDHGEVIFMGKHSTLIINGGYNNDEEVELGKAEINKDKTVVFIPQFSRMNFGKARQKIEIRTSGTPNVASITKTPLLQKANENVGRSAPPTMPISPLNSGSNTVRAGVPNPTKSANAPIISPMIENFLRVIFCPFTL